MACVLVVLLCTVSCIIIMLDVWHEDARCAIDTCTDNSHNDPVAFLQVLLGDDADLLEAIIPFIRCLNAFVLDQQVRHTIAWATAP